MTLPREVRQSLIGELQELEGEVSSSPKCQEYRRTILDNKQGCCSHCGYTKYVKFGKNKGVQRYKCKACHRSFTEYPGTWMAGLHQKDKIKKMQSINKKTAFDWRHKILSSIESVTKDSFTGITEKGKQKSDGKSRNRGGSSLKRGINSDYIAVIVTQDRKHQIDLTVATAGRLKKWIYNVFWGVSTKYIQQYLNGFRMKEILKKSTQLIKEFAEIPVEDVEAYNRYGQLTNRYSNLLSTQN